MKIAIASEGKDLDSKISNEAGRAPYYMITKDGEVIDTIRNPFARGGGGAGISVAKMLSDVGVDKFVAKSIGPNMIEALEERGIAIEQISGRIKEGIQVFH